MNIKKLEKATKIFEQIKVLDAQIIEIDRFAMLVANGEIKSSFELKVEDIGKKKEDEEKVSFDADGSLIKGDSIPEYSFRINWGSIIPCGLTGSSDKKNKNEHLYKTELSENGTMQILGILLYEKQQQRQALIQKLQSYGVAV